MRHSLSAILVASAMSIGIAQAAPGFGASSQRLGGGAQKAEKQSASTTFETFMALIGFDTAATIEPIATNGVAKHNGKSKECEQAKKAEVARAAEKEDAEGGSSKGRSRTGEPIYLAF